MTLTQKELDEFKRLYKEEYGVDLTDAQAFDKGSRLVRLLKVVLKPSQEATPASSSEARKP
jgi:hypothetical protein